MTINHTSALALILVSCFAGSCKKQLNVFPTTQEVDGNIIVDFKSASTALNGVYYQLAVGGTDFNNVPSSKWYQITEQDPSQLSGLLSFQYGGGLDGHIYTPLSTEVGDIWGNAYAIVNAANGFLKNIDPVSSIAPAAKNQMIAEAKFLRAYANSQLLLYYGQYYDTTSAYGILLRTAFVTPNTIALPRVSVAESYDSILSDLNNAIPDLPGVNTQIWYANEWAAKLLKARVLINRGSASDYAQVIALTDDVITHGPFTLETNVQDIFWSKGLTSNEVILGIDPYPNQTVKWTSYISQSSFGPNSFMTQLFTGDPRASWYIQSFTSAIGNRLKLTKYYPGPANNIKFTPVTENGYAFRLTEAYLLEAEALVESGGSLSTAKTLLETVMGHAGITDYSAVDATTAPGDLQLLIVEEEMKNFVAEAGQDWLAIRRLPFSTIQSLLPNLAGQSLLILPIPQAEILSNSQIKQNPNY